MSDNTAYLQQIQAEYQAIMEKYDSEQENLLRMAQISVPETEKKARLRLLAHDMGYTALHLDFDRWLKDCLEAEDWPGLCKLLWQEAKYDLIPCPLGGFHHEDYFWILLDAFAAGDTQMIERVLPRDLEPITEHNILFFRVMNDLLMAVWYGEEERLTQAVPAAENFLGRKTASGWDKAMVSYLLALYQEEMEEASQMLLAICKGYSRSKCYWLAKKQLCTNIHGLYCLAQYYFEKKQKEELFYQLRMPEYKNFSKEFARWRIEHPQPELSPYFTYPEELVWLNQIYEAPPAKLLIWNNFSYAMEMQRQLVAEIWEKSGET